MAITRSNIEGLVERVEIPSRSYVVHDGKVVGRHDTEGAAWEHRSQILSGKPHAKVDVYKGYDALRKAGYQ